MRTSAEHRAEGERLLSLAAVHLEADRHDRVSGFAALAQAHFAAATAMNAIEMIREAAAEMVPAVEVNPTTVLIDFLRTIRDCSVRTCSRNDVLTVFDPKSSAGWDVDARIGRTAARAGLATEDTSGRWQLTGRGREAADRGSI